MNLISAKNMSGDEAIQLIRQGQQLQCPVCGEILKTVPEEWKPGMSLHGLQCPANFEHYMLVIEDENAMREMRRRMAARAKNS